MNAKEAVIFEEDFQWIDPWLTPLTIDNITENDEATSTPRIDGLQNSEGTYLRNAMWNKGYWFYGMPDEALGSTYVYVGMHFMKFGKTSKQANFRFNPTADAPAGAPVYLEFDWCPWRQGDGTIDLVELQIEISENGNTVNEVVEVLPEHNWEANHKLEWIHAKVSLADYHVTTATRILITLTPKYWVASSVHRWALDNLKVSYDDAATTGINEITNDDEASAEYYNLQGVRVNNPENGLYIRRQGGNVSKCYINK